MTGDWEHPSAAGLADAVTGGAVEPLRRHLAVCVECRVRHARLVRDGRAANAPSRSALDKILGTEGRLRANTTKAAAGSAGPTGRAPRPGELWRVGNPEAVLVWVRRVLDGAVDAVPVVLDTEMADEQTLIVPAQDPLGIELAVIASLRSHVHPDAFLSFVADLPEHVAGQVEEVSAAARQGREPRAPVGPRAHDDDDQRVEYQQTVADLMAGLAPAAWARTRPSHDRAQDDAARLLDLLAQDLVVRHPCRVHPSLPAVAVLPGGAVIRAAARVAFADSSVLVALLPEWPTAAERDVVLSCRALLEQEPGAGAAAVCGGPPDWQAVIVERADTRAAYESPGGRLAPPRPLREPLHVVDALAKYLDLRTPAWEDTEATSAAPRTDLRAVATAAAAAALTDLAAQGRRAHTPAKKQAWTALSPALPAGLADMMSRIVAGEGAAGALDRFLGDGRK